MIIQKKKKQKKAHFMDEVSKIRGINMLRPETRLLFAHHPIKIPGYAPADR